MKCDEITWGGMGYEQWAEQGLLRLRVTGCKAIEDGWMVYEPNGNQRFFKTADTVNVDFDAWLGDGHGCQLGANQIADKTHKIKSSESGYQANTDGVDINNLRLTGND